MKRALKKIKHFLRWMFSKKVLDAINNGASYEEVQKIVEED